MEEPRGDPLFPASLFIFLPSVNRAFNLLEMIGKRGFQKIGRSIMGWRKYFALERRRRPRYPIAIDVEFYVWDEGTKKPASAKVTGRLVNISVKGGCLQTNTVRIGYHHLVVNNDLEGKTPLILEFPPSSEGIPWRLKSQILWYNKIGIEGEFKFKFGIGFVDIPSSEQKHLESLIKFA